jgi:hypothetical protein
VKVRKTEPASNIPPACSLSPLDWNFDSVPVNQLIACCYWEYARESAFIRDVRQRCLKNWRSGGHRDQQLYTDLEKLQGIGYASEVFIRGFFFEPDIKYQSVNKGLPNYRHPDAPPITGSFPQPWQSLSTAERNSRSYIRSDRTTIPLVPFERGRSVDVKDIVNSVTAQLRERDETNEQVRRENPKLTEETLCRMGKLQFPDICPSVIYGSGWEETVVRINWSEFTNDEIATYFRPWVKANRPKNIMAPSGKGHKPKDWRANLTRLAVMRLLLQFSPFQIFSQNSFPAIWETKQFSGRKWEDITKWHDARREAGKLFRNLFPFLPLDEKPISWTRQARSK